MEAALRACGTRGANARLDLLDEVRAKLFDAAPLRPRLGRYELRARIGSGGGGVVLRAWDPELCRDVAIKIVHVGSGEEARLRLAREARALARLSHPNVVEVFDAGRVDARRENALVRFLGGTIDGSVFLVMEWLDGGDLAQWLGARDRPWREIVDVFRAAGRGLAAAHAAGLLHRDFKPHNVLRGRDGRLRVADFGLTCSRPRPATDDDAIDDLVVSLAVSGASGVMGTPLYMAPEQHTGGEIDERTDQYAFALALHEALWGVPRFASLDALVAAKFAGPLPPGTRRVPAALVRVVERALQPDPARRFPSMAALLAALDRIRVRPRRHTAIVGTALAALGALAAGRMERAPLCRADDPGWASVWGDRRDAIATAWAERAGAFGRESFVAVEGHVGALGREWSELRDRSCAASTDDAPIAACLASQRLRMQALIEAWVDAPVDGIAAAVPAVRALEIGDDPCASGSLVAAERDEVLARDVARIDALVAAGRFADASALADDVAPSIAAAADADASAALLAMGTAHERAGRWAEAERDLTDAAHRAEASGDVVATVRAAASLVTVTGVDLDRFDDAERWQRHALAALTRAEADDGTLRAVVHTSAAQLAMARGDWRVARDNYADALDVAEALGHDDLARARALADLAAPTMQLGQHDEAIARYEEALVLLRAHLGEYHPTVATTRHNLANPLALSGRLDRAREETAAALDAWVTAFGERHPSVALARHTLGTVCNRSRDSACAIEQLGQALALRTELLGPEHRETLLTQLNLANAYEGRGEFHSALGLLRGIAEIYDRSDERIAHRGLVYLSLGNMERRTGALADALGSLQRALEMLRADNGPLHLTVGLALLNLAMVERDLGHHAAATKRFASTESVMLSALGASDPRLALVYLERGHLAVKEGDPVRARVDYDRGLAALAGTEHSEVERGELLAAIARLGEVPGR
jgi:eukaryotic-like serine/threonine-protein kinase